MIILYTELTAAGVDPGFFEGGGVRGWGMQWRQNSE